MLLYASRDQQFNKVFSTDGDKSPRRLRCRGRLFCRLGIALEALVSNEALDAGATDGTLRRALLVHQPPEQWRGEAHVGLLLRDVHARHKVFRIQGHPPWPFQWTRPGVRL